MGKIVLPQSRLKAFANLVTRELGVRVRLRGKEICVVYKKPPIIFLPAMEGAREADLLPIYGFALHECAHLRYTDRKVSMSAPNYLVKMLHNAIEDEYIERMLEKDFPGAREMLTGAYVDGINIVFGTKPMVDAKSWLSEERRDEVKSEMAKMRMDAGDDVLVADVAKRLEILRVAKLWILEKRRYPLPLHDWPSHPWREVFEQETTPRARNTKQTYEQSVRIIKRLGVKPCLPGDARPIDVAKGKTDEATRRKEEFREARRKLLNAMRERNAEIRRRREECDEHRELIDAGKAVGNAKSVLENAELRLAKTRERLKKAENAGTQLRARLEKRQREQAELAERVAKASSDEERRILAGQSEELNERIKRMEEAVEQNGCRVHALREQEQKEAAGAKAAAEVLERAQDAAKSAQEAYAEAAKAIRNEVRTRHAPIIDPLMVDAKAKAGIAKEAAAEAEKAYDEIKKRDGKISEPVTEGAMERVVAELFRRFRLRSAEDELEEIMDGAGGEGKDASGRKPGASGEIRSAKAIVGAALPDSGRTYCVPDRSHDRTEKIAETPAARAQYEKAKAECSGIIRETTERLKRLHVPTLSRLKFNAERGRLDPRKAYRVGLGLRGVPVDLSKVWRTTTVRHDSKIAVSLLIDCSGSMASTDGDGETPIAVARKTALVLSEVLSGLGIWHEILGHTTCSTDVPAMLQSGEIAADDLEEFSRIVPFRGYIFKGFNETAIPASVFSNIELQDNLDGEGLLWAAERLAVRPEKSKLLISISDGMPSTVMSNTAELERHLLMVCKQIETREREGVFLFGIGIGVERARHFYRNAETLMTVGDLPTVVLGIVERTLQGSPIRPSQSAPELP